MAENKDSNKGKWEKDDLDFVKIVYKGKTIKQNSTKNDKDKKKEKK